MPDQRGTLEVVANTLAALLQPLDERIGAGDIRQLLAELGLQFPPAVETAPEMRTAAAAAVDQLRALPELVTELADAVDADDAPQIVAAGLRLAGAVVDAIGEIERVAGTLTTAGAGAGIPPGELEAFADTLPRRLVDYLVVRRLEGIPGAAEALEFLGAVERTDLPAVDPQHPAFTRRELHLDQLTDALADPGGHLRARYGWGAPGFDGDVLLTAVHRLLTRAGVPAVLDTSQALPVLDVVFLEVQPTAGGNPPGLHLRVAHPVAIDTAAPFVQDDWQVRMVSDAAIDVGAEIVVQPDDRVAFTPADGEAAGDILVEWTGGASDGPPYLVLGQPDGSRIEVQQLVVRAGAGLAWDAAAGQAEGAFRVAGEVKGGRIVVSLDGADGFLGSILAGFGLESDFSLGLGYSTADGVHFHGSATLEIQLPLHVALGPVDLRALTLSAGLADGALPVGAAVDLKAALGPLQAVVEQIGVRADLRLTPDGDGNVGAVDVGFAFQPPKGVGLSLDVGVVKGGGFLFLDPDRGEYAGALELTFSDLVSLKAIGIITTRTPDGAQGFSLLVIITAEFGSGIQLGFGFTLLGVGGLLGLHRTMNLQPLMEGIRTGAVNSVMFPQDVVANAPKIISDLRAFFPPQQGLFLIGPMAKLGWGTPTLISLSLGVIIEIPGNVAILGVLRVALPADKTAVVVLQVNFAGAIEFDTQRLYFFAAMFESRILFAPIEGEMGLLVAYGADASFVASVGGFHPRFSPPPLPFPSPRRVSIELVNTPAARVRVEGYLAVTSNTAQFGARVDLFFGLSALNVSGHLGFDALFQFSPFAFVIQISASLSVKVFGVGLFSVSVKGTLEGPTPWRAHGKGKIKLLFVKISVNFDVTWGESRDTTLPPIEVMPLLLAELDKQSNWEAELPPGARLLVSTRSMPAEEAALVLHPVGVLRISQRLVPLDLPLDKVGNQRPSDVTRLAVGVAGGGLAQQGETTELFAPAQFQDLDDDEKLSRPAFAPQTSGVVLSASGAQLQSSRMVKRRVRYEEIIVDTNYKRFVRRLTDLAAQLFAFFLQGSAVARSEVSMASYAATHPFADVVRTEPEGFTVAHQATNQAFASDAVAFASEASARVYLADRLADDPTLAESLHVIPEFERVG